MTLDPLTDYLQPSFGNIHADGLTLETSWGDVRPWSAELREAVTHYLVHEVTDEDYARFLDELIVDVPDGSREEQAVFIMEWQLPWEVASAFHWAAVNAVPILDQLLGNAMVWGETGQRDDVAVWLDSHATEDQLAELAEYTNHPERDPATPWYQPHPQGEHFTQRLPPSQLLEAWDYVVGPASSDLTDGEWELLASWFPPRKNPSGRRVDHLAHQLAQRRRSYDGVRYRFANKIPWSRIPRRYGSEHSVYQRFYLDKKAGVFVHLAQSLRDVPEAAELVAWLKQVDDPRETAT